jgi:hypothetical protein
MHAAFPQLSAPEMGWGAGSACLGGIIRPTDFWTTYWLLRPKNKIRLRRLLGLRGRLEGTAVTDCERRLERRLPRACKPRDAAFSAVAMALREGQGNSDRGLLCRLLTCVAALRLGRGSFWP